MRIGDVPMKCRRCGSVFRLEDCNGDDPIGDGLFGCPIEDCGGEMDCLNADCDAEKAASRT